MEILSISLFISFSLKFRHVCVNEITDWYSSEYYTPGKKNKGTMLRGMVFVKILYLNHKLSNQKARFVPRDQAINHGVPSSFPHIIV